MPEFLKLLQTEGEPHICWKVTNKVSLACRTYAICWTRYWLSVINRLTYNSVIFFNKISHFWDIWHCFYLSSVSKPGLISAVVIRMRSSKCLLARLVLVLGLRSFTKLCIPHNNRCCQIPTELRNTFSVAEETFCVKQVDTVGILYNAGRERNIHRRSAGREFLL
jgi:hypothetical protein